MTLLKRLLTRRKKNFFNYFQRAADILHTTSEEFCHALREAPQVQQAVDRIADYEMEGNKIAYTSLELLHKTFITPFDRHDMHRLTQCLDDILNLIHSCAQRLPYYRFDLVPPNVIRLADLSLQASDFARQAVYHLHTLKKADEIFKLCQSIEEIMGAAHKVVIDGERELFESVQDFKEFYKVKDLYARIKFVINRCNDLSNVIRGIVLEYT